MKKDLWRFLPGALLLIFGLVLSWFAYYNELWEGGGDNQWHYWFSKYAYKKPEFFLHHWGKPFFILLSGPFAQLGFYGIIIFNVMVGLCSAYTCYLFVKKLGFSSPWMAIILLLTAPLYFIIIQSAMTEPLFGLLLILTSYLLFSERYVAGALVASFLMYTRTEGAFMIPIFGFYLCMVRQWKTLPLLAVAFVVYSLVGYFMGHDLLWFFTENPYAETSVYGNGTWLHFIEKYRVILGIPQAVLFISGLIFLFILLIRDRELTFKQPSKNMKLLLLVVVPFGIYTFFHIYAWAMGKYASAGLERVLAPVIPYTVILSMYPVSVFSGVNLNRYLKWILTIIFIYVLFTETFHYYQYPLKAYDNGRIEKEAALWFSRQRKPGYKVYYGNPAVLFLAGDDPYQPLNLSCNSFPGDYSFKKGEGFYYVWDSQFSESSCGNKLDDLKNNNELKLIKTFETQELKLCFFEHAP